MQSHPSLIFSFAFRSLFILAVLQALIHVSLWSAMWNGLLGTSVEVNPIYWHGHEMAIGFAGAAIAGFLLTAVATWTGRPQVQGWPLIVLSILWLVARLTPISPILAAVSGVAYWLFLFALMTREVVSASNRRNYKVLALLFIFIVLESIFQFALLSQSPLSQQVLWSQIFLVIVMINLIGGRIIPAFTRNWLMKQRGSLTEKQSPAAFGLVDTAATVSLVLFFIAVLVPIADLFILALAAIASSLQAWRLIRWKGYLCLADPLVWMMHLSYLWIPIGVLLIGLGQAGHVAISAGIHALTIGTVASMIVSIAARAALGHTGRPLESHILLTGSIILLALAAIARVGASLTASDVLMTSATTFWISGFLCFAIRYLPVLLAPPRG
ncbi:MAG: short-chain dehydrogenase [Pseudohongiella sp.]|nr:MAG: short-chain dehydrogenase [Pseudohongiella sp.]